MRIVVQKFGGSSLADQDRIRRVAQRVVKTRESGNHVVVVVSAMGKTTDELLAMARGCCANPDRRELDMLVTAGERISMAILAMVIKDLGHDAISFTGSQSGIITNDRHFDARIIEVRPYRIQDELERDRIVIVAGYQGVSYRREITTLGRGGSDTTAVALAAALGAERCEIYSDVDGVYSADPRIVPDAHRWDELGYEEMQEMAEAGAKVLHAQAVEIAKRAGIAIYCRATDGTGGQTIIRNLAPAPPPRITGVVCSRGMAVATIATTDSESVDAALSAVEDLGVDVRELRFRPTAQPGGELQLVLALAQHPDPAGALLGLSRRFSEHAHIAADLAALSVIGTGITKSLDNVRRAWRLCSPCAAMSTSSFRISFIVEAQRLEALARSVHGAMVAAGEMEAHAASALEY
ncbi:MAG: aspartate kinase [Candidatus Schekmanbacteria bacterium]|nr:aspartate kinase [Candidatus Schekmanbacteria bacterium]